MYFRRLRGLKEDWDMTQREVGNLLGISHTAYSLHERGERNRFQIEKQPRYHAAVWLFRDAYFLPSMAAWAAAKRAIGTRKGEQET